MKAYLTLMRLSLRNRIGAWRRESWYKPSGKLDVSRIVTTAMVLLSFAYLAGLMIFVEVKLFGVLASMGQPMLLMALALMLGMVSTLLLGIFITVSSLYFQRDSAWLAYLPVSPYAVLGMRWTGLWAGDAALNAVFIAPAALLYGLHTGADALYYLRMLAIILATPLIPLAISTLLASLLSRATVLFRHKDAMAMVGSLLIVFVVVGLEMSILPRIPEDAGALYFVQLLLNQEGLINLLLGSFPPILWAAKGLAGDWGLWALFLLVSVGAAALALLLAGRNYMNTCMQQAEHAAKKRRGRLQLDAWRVRSPLAALCLREWRELIRTPVYAMNALSGVIMLPLMMVIMGIGIQSSGESTELIIPMIQGLLSQVSGWDLTLILTAILSFAGLMNPVASTSVSREGARLPLSRMIPIASEVQLHAKLLVSMAVSLMTHAAMAVLMAVVLRAYALWLIPATVLATLLSYAASALSLVVECVRPQLNWANETQAMKQNMNFAIMMLGNLVLVALPALAAVALMKQGAEWRFVAAAAVLAVETGAAWVLMKKVAVPRYRLLEG